MNISGRHFNSNFSHSLAFHCLALLILQNISICCGWFLFTMSYYVNVPFTP